MKKVVQTERVKFVTNYEAPPSRLTCGSVTPPDHSPREKLNPLVADKLEQESTVDKVGQNFINKMKYI